MSQDKESTGKSRTRKSTTATKQTTSNNSNEKVIASDQEQTLKIEISKYTSLVNALGGTKWFRMTVSVCVIGVFLFFCIFMVAFAIKRIYPYSDITTNGLGATTLKSEKGEVSYWLFNTASLWANSGITVKKGDIITIRCSGKYHTAIHHLYDDVKGNKELQDKWIGSEGYPENKKEKNDDFHRSKFRIFPGMNNGALVMQVATDEPFDTPLDSNSNGKPAKADNFYYIGKERQHIYINNPGTLYFAINDIVLNERTIKDMLYYSIINNDTIPISLTEANSAYKRSVASLDSILFGKIYDIKSTTKGVRSKGVLKLGITEDDGIRKSELKYYYDNRYKTAWFDDNVGSLLILIEKETR